MQKDTFHPSFHRPSFRLWFRIVATFSVVNMLFASIVWTIPTAQAATMGQISWVQGRIKASTAADSVRIRFTVPTGVDASTDTITLTFDSGVVLAAEVATNFDFEVGDGATCSTATFTDEALALTAAAGTWGVDVTGQAITLTAPTDATTGEITAGRCVQLLIGTNATLGGTGSGSALTNGTAANYDVDITSELGTTDDSGSGSISIIADDQVSVTATVDPTITFTLSDTTIGFGTLTSSAGRWATGDLNGAAASAGSNPDAAHTMTIATNAQSGYAITYNGATLTSGGNTIDVASVSGDSDGTPGSEQFGLSVSTDGNATIASGYQRDTTADFTWVASTTTTIVSEIVATATETISASYLGNIAATTEAGSYTTTVTYIASGTF
ncbi:MAG: hypothetical protein HY340_01315 [Candidatus Kerfeldbacteria bacterium]|nr:hypothetical protein [Candidatus Kerfeldbacteria bacterium]